MAIKRCKLCGMIKHEDGGCGGPGQPCNGMPVDRIQVLMTQVEKLRKDNKALKEDKDNLRKALDAALARAKVAESQVERLRTQVPGPGDLPPPVTWTMGKVDHAQDSAPVTQVPGV